MAGFLKPMNEWTIRGVVLLSLGAHVALAITAGIRRRESTGWRMLLLWLAYLVANWAATYALSNLSLAGGGGGTGTGNANTSRERPDQQQLVAFWVPFLLTHLGGPDNITAYSLEDNKLSLRQAVHTVLQVLGTSFVIYRQLYIGGNGTLLWASVVMAAVGVAKYLERAWALREGDFGRIRSSSKKQRIRLRIKQPHGHGGRRRSKLCDEQALVVAHDLLHITKGAFADYSIHEDEDPLKRDTNSAKAVFSYGLENMCKVVEMELSLMYDILYTKAAVIHTWVGYSIRVASLTATAMVIIMLFLSLYSTRDYGDGHKREDILVTFILLGATFILDVAWLTRAALSTWTYAFLDARPQCWLHHSLLCTRRWHQFRRAVMSLHPRREPNMGSYRLWSGTMGQYNLLHECTHDTASLFSMLVKKIASEEIWMEYQYSRGLELHISDHVRKLLFEQIARARKLAYPATEEAVEKKKEAEEKKKKKEEEEKCRPCRPPWVPNEAKIKRHRLLDETLRFVLEFQELILIWHIATDVFLLCSDQQLIKQLQKDQTVEAIKALSNYMVFLVTVRPDMIPGLKLRSLCDVTRQVLDKIWKDEAATTSCSTTSPVSISATRDKHLAGILRGMEKPPNGNWSHGYTSALHRLSVILSDGTKFAQVLEARLNNTHWDTIAQNFGIAEKDSEKRILFLIPELERGTALRTEALLELIFKSWVRMLIFVSTRCGRDSHTKQLGRGCDLITIVWILAEHAGIFRIR